MTVKCRKVSKKEALLRRREREFAAGLLALADVIDSLILVGEEIERLKGEHSYRYDSKIVRLLKDSIGVSAESTDLPKYLYVVKLLPPAVKL